jgi:hypothetical protein
MMLSYAELHIQLARKTVHRSIPVPRKMKNLHLSLPVAHTSRLSRTASRLFPTPVDLFSPPHQPHAITYHSLPLAGSGPYSLFHQTHQNQVSTQVASCLSPHRLASPGHLPKPSYNLP